MSIVTFKGISSRTMGVTAKVTSWPVLAAYSRSIIAVPKRPGSVDFEIDTPGEAEAGIMFTWLCRSQQEALQKCEELSGWLNNDGQYYPLTNSDYPNRKYMAKVTSAIPMIRESLVASVTVLFTINPPYPFALDNSPVSPQDVQDRLLWDTGLLDGSQYAQTFSGDGYMRLTLAGTGTDRPRITIIGYIPSGFSLGLNDLSWQYNSLLAWDGIVIDCEAETVTRLSDGENLFANTGPSDYFELSPGQIQIDVAGVSGPWPNDVTVIVELTPSYGG